MDIININLISLIVLVVAAGIDVAVWQYITEQLVWEVALSSAVLGVLNVVLVWVLLGTYVAKRLAVPAVVVGGMSAAQAMGIGWRFYVKAGGHLVAAALEIVVVRVFALAVIGLLVYSAINANWGSDALSIAVGSGLLAAIVSFLAVMVLLEVEMRIWQRQYRQWASMFPAALRFRLTTGRVKAQP